MLQGLLRPWGPWTPFRILVVRDLWAAVWRLSREGGDDCHAILAQLAAKWTFIREPNPQIDRHLRTDPDLRAQLRRHITLADNFSSSLKTEFDQYRGLRKPRRSAEEKEIDKHLALVGDSSSKMTKVWETWMATTIRLLERSKVSFPHLPWAWNQRFASCPPLHHTFRKHILDPLDTQDVEPVEKPARSTVPMDWPCSKRELLLVHPWRGVPAAATEPEVEDVDVEVEIEVEVGIRRSGRLADKVAPKADDGQTETTSRGGGGNSKPRTRKNNGGGGGGRGRSYSRKPLREEEGRLAIKAEEEHIPGMPHPVWDVIDIDAEPHNDTSTLDRLTLYVNGKIEPVDGREPVPEPDPEILTVVFFTGMVSLPFYRVLYLLMIMKEGRSSSYVKHA